MKVFKRKSLPLTITYNGRVYKPNMTISAGMNKSSTPADKVIEAVKSTGEKAILVEVLSFYLKRKTDFHGKPYVPSKWIYTT